MAVTQALTQKYARHARVDTRHQRVIKKKKVLAASMKFICPRERNNIQTHPILQLRVATEAGGTNLTLVIEGEKEFWGGGGLKNKYFQIVEPSDGVQTLARGVSE